MANINDTIRAALDAFVEDISNLIQQAALESVEEALAGASVIPGRRGRGAGRAAAASFASLDRNRKKGAKRTAEELEELTKQLHSYIAKNPGQRIEQIAQGLDITTKELNLPAKKLIGDKKLSTKGQKRATTYFAK
ncbi:MAG TPA: DNA-binding protein [Polyangiaceae bacterium]|jgi:DNA-binding NtrC family response regulator|nr:DNA-binding protein [Polyangiaceae bacterium]